MLVGYARVSTMDQSPALQIDALNNAGCDRIFEEKASGAQRDRPELNAAMEYNTCATATRSSCGSLIGWRAQ